MFINVPMVLSVASGRRVPLLLDGVGAGVSSRTLQPRRQKRAFAADISSATLADFDDRLDEPMLSRMPISSGVFGQPDIGGKRFPDPTHFAHA